MLSSDEEARDLGIATNVNGDDMSWTVPSRTDLF